MNVSEYNQCVDLFSDAIFRYLRANGLDEDAAMDIVQDAFEMLWRRREHVELKKAKSYLFQVAYHDMIDLKRKEKKTVCLDLEHDDTIPAIEFTGVYEAVKAGLDRLPEDQRQVLLLRDYEGYDYREIGTITGLSESQVKVYIFRARRAMKEFIVKKENVL